MGHRLCHSSDLNSRRARVHADPDSALPGLDATLRLHDSGCVNGTDLYSGNRLSQERVLSYTELVMGETLAQRTIDRLDLDMSAATLKERVTAQVETEHSPHRCGRFVDHSPVRARDIANALSDEFVVMVRELETPAQRRRRLKPASSSSNARRSPTLRLIPKKKRNLALGIVLGAMLGIGLALLRDQLDNTIKNQETLEEIDWHRSRRLHPVRQEARREATLIAFDHRQLGNCRGIPQAADQPAVPRRGQSAPADRRHEFITERGQVHHCDQHCSGAGRG